MGQVATRIIGCLTFLILVGASGQAVAQVTSCNGPGDPPNTWVVNTPAEAADLVAQGGYSNNTCNLEVRQTLGDITVTTFTLRALSILVESATPADPAQRIMMIGVASASAIQFLSVGDITLNGATIKAHKNLRFACSQSLCNFESDQSDIITANNFNAVPLGAGGVITFDIDGSIDIQTTNLHGGDSIEMGAKKGSITLICGGGPTGCKDPNVAPIPQIILDQCTGGTGVPPIIFPCTPTFPDSVALRDVCFPAAAVQCNGGNKEKRFTAGTFINVENSTIIADEHMTFTCGAAGSLANPVEGDFKGMGAILAAEQIVIRCTGKVNLQGAKLTGDLKGVTVTSGVLCPRAASPGVPAATEPCIDAKGPTPPAADGSNKTLFDGKPVILTARNGLSQINVCNTIAVVPGGNPNLNKDPSPPYPATVFGVVGNLGPDCQPPDEPLEINP